MMRLLRTLFAVSVLALPALPAQAANCTLRSSDLAFGISFPGQKVDSSAAVFLDCSSATGPETVSYAVALSAGRSNGYAPRRMNMATGSATLDYNLFSDSNRTQVWGDGTTGTSVVTGSLMVASGMSSATATLPVFGRIFMGQTSTEPGDYSDLLVITLTF